MTAITYTSTLSKDLMFWLNSFVRKEKVTKKDVIELALRKYKDEVKRQKLSASFKRAAKDKEMIYLTEAGLGDFVEQLKRYEA
jgi:hypothetical protein